MPRHSVFGFYFPLFLFSAIGYAKESTPALTAEFTVTISPAAGQTRQIDGRYARSSDGKVREETPTSVIIIDRKAHTASILNPFTREATVIEFKAERDRNRNKTRPPSEAFEDLEDGSEQAVVDGHPVIKRRAVGVQDGHEREIWTAKDLSMPVLIRTTDASKSTTKAFKNIVLREPDPSLFTIPSDYKITTKIDNGTCPLKECSSPPAAVSGTIMLAQPK